MGRHRVSAKFPPVLKIFSIQAGGESLQASSPQKIKQNIPSEDTIDQQVIDGFLSLIAVFGRVSGGERGLSVQTAALQIRVLHQVF